MPRFKPNLDLNARRAETVLGIQRAKRTCDALELLQRFEAAVRHDASPAAAARQAKREPPRRALLGPAWMQQDLAIRALDEANVRLIEAALAFDASVGSGLSAEQVHTIAAEHTAACAAVRRARRTLVALKAGAR